MKTTMKLLLPLIVIMLAFAASAHAEEAWAWRLDKNGGAHITDTALSGAVTIPHEVDRHPVVGIDHLPAAVSSVTVPAGVKEIGDVSVPIRTWNGTYAASLASARIMTKLDLFDDVLDTDSLPGDVLFALHSGEALSDPWNTILYPGRVLYTDDSANGGMGEAFIVTESGLEEYPLAMAMEQISVSATDLSPDFSVLYGQPGVTVISESGQMQPASISYENGALRALSSRSARSAKFELELTDHITANVDLQINSFDFNLDVDWRSFSIQNLKVYVNYDISVSIEGGVSTSSFTNQFRNVRFGRTDYSSEPDDYDITYRPKEKDSFHSYVETGTQQIVEAGMETQDGYKQWQVAAFAAGPVIVRVYIRAYISSSGVVKLEFAYKNAAIGYERINGAGHNLNQKGEYSLTLGAKIDATLGVGLAATASLAIIPDFAEVEGKILLEGKAEGCYDFLHPETGGCFDIELNAHIPITIGFGLKNVAAWCTRITDVFKRYVEVYPDGDSRRWTEDHQKTVSSLSKNIQKLMWTEFTPVDFPLWNKSLHYEYGNGVVEACTRETAVVTWDLDDGTDPYIVRYTKNSILSANDYGTVMRAGYDFLGWFDENGQQLSSRVVDFNNLKLTAHWEKKPPEEEWEWPGIDFGDLQSDPVFVDPGPYYSTYYLSIQNMSDPLSQYLQYTAKEAQRTGSNNYFSIALSNGAQLHAYNGRASTISTLNLGSELFITSEGSAYSPNLTSVTFGPNMTDIGVYDGCVSLQSVTFPPYATAMHERMFTSCISLSSVTLPEGVTELPYYCFGECVSLNTLNLPSSLTAIQSHVFSHAGLTEITLPDGLTFLGECSFYGNKGLTEVSIPENVTSMRYAFANSGLKSVSMPGTGSMSDMEGAFSECSDLETAVLRNGIETIDTNTFLDCPSLTSVSLPDSVQRICVNAFNGCTALPTIDLPNGTYLESWAFVACSGLKTVTGGPSEICQGAFTGCTGLEKVDLNCDEIVIDYAAFGGSSLREATIRGNKITIRGSAFLDCPNLEKVTILGGNVVIENYAFANLQSLKEVRIEGNLSIDYGAFTNSGVESVTLTVTNEDFELNGLNDCPALKSVTVHGTVSNIQYRAFFNDYSLTNVEIDAMSGGIFSNSFENCTALTSFTVPNGAQNIFWDAFEGCDSLEELTIPDSVGYVHESCYRAGVRVVTSVGSYAWNQASMAGLELETDAEAYTLTLTGQFGLEYDPLQVYAGTVMELPAPDSFDGFSFEAWCADAELTEAIDRTFTMPAHDTTLYARWQNYNVFWSNLNAEWVWDNAAGRDLAKILSYNGIYASFFVPDDVYALGADCLDGTLTVVHLGANVREIDDGAFRSATNLRAILVDENNPYFFSVDGILYSESGELVAVPCKTPIKELYLPAWVTSIRDYAIAYQAESSGLTALTIPIGAAQCGDHSFDGMTSGCTAYGPTDGKVAEAMRASAAVYNRYMTIFACDGEIAAMGYAYAGDAPVYPNLRLANEVIVGWSETEGGSIVAGSYTVPVGGSVLYAICEPINWMKTPRDLTAIQKEAFAGTRLAYVYCRNGVGKIGDKAFADCADLKVIRIPGSVTSISANAFEGCGALAIQGTPGSYAEEYAYQNGIAFVVE